MPLLQVKKNALSVYCNKNLIVCWGVCGIWKKLFKFGNFNTKVVFSVMMTLFMTIYIYIMQALISPQDYLHVRGTLMCTIINPIIRTDFGPCNQEVLADALHLLMTRASDVRCLFVPGHNPALLSSTWRFFAIDSMTLILWLLHSSGTMCWLVVGFEAEVVVVSYKWWSAKKKMSSASRGWTSVFRLWL